MANLRTAEHECRKSGELVWIDLPTGGVKCVTDPEWMERHSKNQRAHAEDERKRFNWRLQHPVDEQPL